MNIIKVMSDDLSNKIAAGEVVESLMNIVKELVENSIDADASVIKIYLIESGIKSIKVVDDGKGMSREDCKNSILRHATSKLYTKDDLFNINTLGFRGEALPSIGSVSKMTIATSDGECSTLLEVTGGVITNCSSTDLRRGTSISVCDVFYNTPARFKYLKSLHTELANILNYVNKMALANPSISFYLENDSKVLLNTDGSGNLLKVINSIYGLDVTKKMLKVECSNSDYIVSGYISYPEINRSSRNNITLLVNGRYVRNNDIIRSILEGYHTYLPINRYPIIVLNIKTDPYIIDVNIHPTKMDIKFSKIDELKDMIYNMISTSLNKLTLIPEAKYEQKPISNINNVFTINDKVDFKNNDSKEEIKFEEINFDFNNDYVVSDNEEEYIEKEKMKKITPLALAHGTYIIGENEDGIFLIDQHAANERINYEYYLKELGKNTNTSVDLLVPIKIELSNNEYLSLKENINILEEMGFIYEDFGFNTLIIRSHPSWIKKEYTNETIRKIIEVIIEHNDFDKEKFNEKIAITLACKMSIKANEHISHEEMVVLLERLRNTNNPFTCPHGRPTVITYTIYELEKMFKRVM
jgi:DNA mismatch repair protein MutL